MLFKLLSLMIFSFISFQVSQTQIACFNLTLYHTQIVTAVIWHFMEEGIVHFSFPCFQTIAKKRRKETFDASDLKAVNIRVQ